MTKLFLSSLSEITVKVAFGSLSAINGPNVDFTNWVLPMPTKPMGMNRKILFLRGSLFNTLALVLEVLLDTDSRSSGALRVCALVVYFSSDVSFLALARVGAVLAVWLRGSGAGCFGWFFVD